MTKVDKKISTKTGGRKKGSLNRKTEHIFELCEKHDFDPIEVLIFVATNNWEALGYPNAEVEKLGMGGVVVLEDRITVPLRIDAAKKIADFMYPKRKAIELSGSQEEQPLTISYVPKSKRELIE